MICFFFTPKTTQNSTSKTKTIIEFRHENQRFHFFFFGGVFPPSDFYRENQGETQNSPFLITKKNTPSSILGRAGGTRGSLGGEKEGGDIPHFARSWRRSVKKTKEEGE